MNWNNNPRIHRTGTHQNVNFVHMQEPTKKASHVTNKGNYEFSTQRDLITDLRT